VAARAEREQAEADAEQARGETTRLAKRLEAKLDTAAVRYAVTSHQEYKCVRSNSSAVLPGALGSLSEHTSVSGHCHEQPAVSSVHIESWMR